MSTKNIVLFGQSGVGKSSVVNLIAGQQMATTSPDMQRCTLDWKPYTIAFDGCDYNVFDTVGLEEPELGMKGYLDAIMNTYNLMTKLRNEGGIDLLLFCMRAGRFTATIRSNYRLFYEWLCEKNVPIVLVINGLEGEQNMEEWWTRHKPTFDRFDIVVDDHACITAASGLTGRPQELYDLSRQLVRNIVKEHTRDKNSKKAVCTEVRVDRSREDNGWFWEFVRKLRELLRGNHTPKKEDILTVFTNRCGIPREAAIQLAREVGKEEDC